MGPTINENIATMPFMRKFILYDSTSKSCWLNGVLKLWDAQKCLGLVHWGPAKQKLESIHIHWTAAAIKHRHHFCTTENGRDHFSWWTNWGLLRLSPILFLMKPITFLWTFKMLNLNPHFLMKCTSSCCCSLHQVDCHYWWLDSSSWNIHHQKTGEK